MRPMNRARVLLRWTLGALTAATLLVIGPTAGTSPARAADLSEFDPGNIITDQIFFDSGAMSAVQVQAFLDAKGTRCTAGSLCLSAYHSGTFSKSATQYCPGGYAGLASESAASIIWKVAQACGVNPQVLLVTLQKEQGLVTATSPTQGKYDKAMGYGCPDTAACDTQYYGLQNQLYSAASQFRRYVTNPSKYSYRAGVVNDILYHPHNDCGRQSVYIQNGATAALYNYTPYVPNVAALNAGYGEGDSCSAYGNRNFFSYFTDWFGSTQSSGSGAINLTYKALGGSTAIGDPVAATQCGLPSSGCARAYTQGSIYWSPASGAAYVTGPSLGAYWNNGAVGGPLGYPIASSGNITGGAATAFQGGSIYWSSATGARVVTKDMLAAWWNSGGVSGPLGFPIADSAPVAGGRATAFSGGSVYWSAGTGAHWLSGPVLSRYWATGVTTGPLGFPISSLGPVPGGQAAAFQGGSIYSSASTGARAVTAEALRTWWATGGVSGPLGFPTADSVAVAGGRVTEFGTGSVYWSKSTRAHVVQGDILAYYEAQGGPAALGFPTADQGPVTGGSALATQKVSIYSSASTGTHAVHGGVRAAWWATGGITGPLGFPTADVGVTAGVDGLVGNFSGGAVYWSTATGGRMVQGDILAYYEAQGGPAALGFPIADQGPVTGGTALAAQKVSIYSSAATGTHSVHGGVRTAWWATGGITGPLGFPTADVGVTAGVDGLVGNFSGGAVYWSTATGGRMVQGDILAYYEAQGGPAALGFPIADQGPVTGGTALAAQKVSIYSSAATGTHSVYGALRTAWWATGGITGPLGFPTTDVTTVAGTAGTTGLVVDFSGGAVYWSEATGARVVTSAVLSTYRSAGGPASTYGWPVSDTYAVPGGSRNDFQDGQITG
ncbi:uncharacterized protein with LGFP repeats [Blastococcus colisei]|uniref:Uncharacterized protein with LGFP repeats n=1 Tax=Blastococcus colisei TaxID=1564162 RepID=A0A543PBQ6_9ACTN|nr:hypothetical protein [Blastococcus colisei]TQN41519.1 uncharacterized protein with LGFP repeats [Blastococcus colisei]